MNFIDTTGFGVQQYVGLGMLLVSCLFMCGFVIYIAIIYATDIERRYFLAFVDSLARACGYKGEAAWNDCDAYYNAQLCIRDHMRVLSSSQVKHFVACHSRNHSTIMLTLLRFFGGNLIVTIARLIIREEDNKQRCLVEKLLLNQQYLSLVLRYDYL